MLDVCKINTPAMQTALDPHRENSACLEAILEAILGSPTGVIGQSEGRPARAEECRDQNSLWSRHVSHHQLVAPSSEYAMCRMLTM